MAKMADILVSLGAESAINLDGGGSATGVVDRVLVSQPSDECGSVGTVTQHCERDVTSITCIR